MDGSLNMKSQSSDFCIYTNKARIFVGAQRKDYVTGNIFV
jgi:hypothetical protein